MKERTTNQDNVYIWSFCEASWYPMRIILCYIITFLESRVTMQDRCLNRPPPPTTTTCRPRCGYTWEVLSQLAKKHRGKANSCTGSEVQASGGDPISNKQIPVHWRRCGMGGARGNQGRVRCSAELRFSVLAVLMLFFFALILPCAIGVPGLYGVE